MKTLGWTVLCLLFLVSAGRSDDDKNNDKKRESILKEAIGHMDDMAAAMEKAATAKEAEPKLLAAFGKLKDTKKREEALGKQTKAETQALLKKFEPEMKRLTKRVESAVQDLAKKDPKGITILLPIFQEMGSWK